MLKNEVDQNHYSNATRVVNAPKKFDIHLQFSNSYKTKGVHLLEESPPPLLLFENPLFPWMSGLFFQFGGNT